MTTGRIASVPFRLRNTQAKDVGCWLLCNSGLILFTFSLCIGLIWRFFMSPLNTPDEPAHLQAVMVVRNRHILPEVHYDFSSPVPQMVNTPGDESVRVYARSVGFTGPFETTPYESMQPPLYYLLAGILANGVPGDPQTVLYLCRALSVLFGAGTVFLCWITVLEIKPGAYAWAAFAAATLALLPQFGFNSASASNDGLLNFVSACLFYVLLKALRNPNFDRYMVISGGLLGLAVLTKLSALAFVPGVGIAILFRAMGSYSTSGLWRERLPGAFRMTLGAAISSLIVCGWWFVRNLMVYGEISGSRDALRYYSVRGVGPLLNITDPASLGFFLHNSWESFWGRFGWMNIMLPQGLYQQAMFISALALGLTAFALLRPTTRRRITNTHLVPYLCVIVSVALTLVAGYFQFSATVGNQPQSRYLFPLLVPIAVAFTYGIYALVPGRLFRPVFFTSVLAWLAYIGVFALASGTL